MLQHEGATDTELATVFERAIVTAVKTTGPQSDESTLCGACHVTLAISQYQDTSELGPGMHARTLPAPTRA